MHVSSFAFNEAAQYGPGQGGVKHLYGKNRPAQAGREKNVPPLRYKQYAR